MARLNIVIPDEMDRELDLLCANKSELARRGIQMALDEHKKFLRLHLVGAAANDAPKAAPAPPSLDDVIGRGSLLADGQLKTVFPYTEVCTYLEVSEEEAANDMIEAPIFHDGRNWVTHTQILELCTLSPHPAKADSLKQWA